jgi:anti-sigma B factor antagonist
VTDVPATPPTGVTLTWRGEIDLENAFEHRRELSRAMDTSDVVYVDLAGVTLMDSTGLGVLLAGWRRARTLNGAVVVTNPSSQVRRSLELMGVLHLLTALPGGAAG